MRRGQRQCLENGKSRNECSEAPRPYLSVVTCHMADSRRQLVGDRAPGPVRLYTKQISIERRSNAAQNYASVFRTYRFCIGRGHALTAPSWFPLQLAGFADGISSDTSVHVVQFPSVINIFVVIQLLRNTPLHERGSASGC